MTLVIFLCSSLGSSPAEVGNRGCTLTQMQLWRLWRDCKIHHRGITLYNVDNVICKSVEFEKWICNYDIILVPDTTSGTSHDPNHTFLMREFLQLLVYLSNHLINNQEEKRYSCKKKKYSLSFIATTNAQSW